jgi:hypothetical protein
VRQYIRHPFDVTIRYTVGEAAADGEALKNIGEGGLCFHSPQAVAPGSKIHIEIPLMEGEPFAADGVVVWCREHDGYEIGVRFDEATRHFSLRMVEQLCHIKHYRQEILATEGRELSYEEAALEWIEKYARVFPR